MNYECPESYAGSEHGNRGARYSAAGNLDEAEKETRQAIRIDPDCSMWQQNLGFILRDNNRRDEANKAFLASLRIDKFWCTAYKTGSLLEIGRYYYDKRKYKESISYLTQAIDMATKENADTEVKAHIYTNLSFNYTDPKELGNPFYNLKKAEQIKKQALALKPNDLYVKASLAKLYVLQKRTDEAGEKKGHFPVFHFPKMGKCPYYSPIIPHYSFWLNPARVDESG